MKKARCCRCKTSRPTHKLSKRRGCVWECVGGDMCTRRVAARVLRVHQRIADYAVGDPLRLARRQHMRRLRLQLGRRP